MSETLLDTTYFVSDKHFDELYPKKMQQLSEKHWSPVHVAVSAADFLAEQPGSRILDIGSGNGKFCLLAGQNNPGSHFFGIEQRESLIQTAKQAQKILAIENVTFLHGNFTKLDLNQFDHFYFYNSFYENIVDEQYHIDESIEYSLDLYEYYTGYLYNALEGRPSGTRLATYHSYHEVVPPGYRLVESTRMNYLRCWIKD